MAARGLGAGLLLLLGLVACGGQGPSLGSYGELPAFALKDQRGVEVRAADLKGRVLVVDFIFTSCPDICPLLTQQLAGIRRELQPQAALAFVSFSVDPEHDTPERLKQFAAQHRADHPDWYFLTGPLELVRKVVTSGFKQAMQAEPVVPGKPRNVLHGTHFVLVDRTGQIRGFYRNDSEGTEQLQKAAAQLLAERKPG
jgi:protein SCO1/2